MWNNNTYSDNKLSDVAEEKADELAETQTVIPAWEKWTYFQTKYRLKTLSPNCLEEKLAIIWENISWWVVDKVVICEKEKKRDGNLLLAELEGANLEGRENYGMSWSHCLLHPVLCS